jgi:hypothetical protein
MLVAGIVLVVVAAPWFLAVTREMGPGFLHAFLVGENIERFATSRFNSWRGWDYFPIIVGGLLPWSVFGLLWIRPLAEAFKRRQAPGPVEMRLIAWALAPLAFFFVSVGSQPRYILPCLVPMAILLARSIAQHLSKSDRTFVVAAVVAGLSIVTLGVLLFRAEPVLQALSANSAGPAAIAVMAAGVVVLMGALAAPRRVVPVLITAGAAVGLVAFDRTLLSPGRPEPVEITAAAARDAGVSPTICACGAFARSLNYYTHVKTVIADTGRGADEALHFLSAPGRVLAVVDSKTLADVESQLGRTLPRLGDVRYLNTSLWMRPSFLFRPDPAAVQRVVLVSTQ